MPRSLKGTAPGISLEESRASSRAENNITVKELANLPAKIDTKAKEFYDKNICK